MAHHFIKIITAEYLNGYVLKITFEDKSTKIIDFKPVLHGELYSPLLNLEFFKRHYIDLETGTLNWPNGADFDPSMIYEWENAVDELAQRLLHYEQERLTRRCV
jgi:hypothetical protein